MEKLILKQLCQLEEQTKALRRKLGVSAAGETIFQAPKGMWSERDVVVEADGCGGATLYIVKGNYPADYFIHKTEFFESEDAACEAAEQLITP